MKIAIVTDVHYGKNRNNPFLLQETNNFFTKQFFPTLDEIGNVEAIINAGDIFDARINIGIPAIEEYRKSYEVEINKRQLDHHHILGNHDVLLGSSNRINSPQHIFQMTYGYIHDKAVEYKFDKTRILFVPWINKENYDHTMELIRTTDAKILIGHLEISGFDHGGTRSHGLEQSLFKKFDLVMSGHFHKQQKIGNIYYLGNHLNQDWGEYGNPVGFHIYDTETGDLEFIENHDYQHFKKIVYTEGMKVPSNVEGKNVKIVHGAKVSESDFERLVKGIEDQKPYNLQFVDETKVTLNKMIAESVEEEVETKDIPEIIVNYVAKIDTDTVSEEFKEGVANLLLEAYKEARAN